MTKTHEGLIRWVAASDPWVECYSELICHYCKKEKFYMERHAPDCWYTWCCEWVNERPTELERAGMQQFVDFISGHENLEIKIDDDERTGAEPA